MKKFISLVILKNVFREYVRIKNLLVKIGELQKVFLDNTEGSLLKSKPRIDWIPKFI